MGVTALSEIDFAGLYRTAASRAGRSTRPRGYWDDRARSMSDTILDDEYVAEFVRRMDLSGARTLLDVGCGPGTIALAVAAGLEHVYGLDYSAEMIAVLGENARRRGVQNVTPILRSWEDDWDDVPVCDIVVASRSTAVADLEAAFLKIESKARQRVYVSYPADGTFMAGEVSRAIGRPVEGLPDYLCVVGILHHLGRYPTLDYLPGESRLKRCPTYTDFRDKVVGLLGSLTAAESQRLEEYYEMNRERFGRERMRWAFCSWKAPGAATAPGVEDRLFSHPSSGL